MTGKSALKVLFLTIIALELLLAGAISSQIPDGVPYPEKAYPKLESILGQLVATPQLEQSLIETGKYAGLSRYFVADSGRGLLIRVVVEAESQEQIEGIVGIIRSLGGEVETTYRELVQALVPILALPELADQPGVEFVRLPFWPHLSQGKIISEGTAEIGVAPWHQNGLTGRGVRIAIIDTFEGYRELLGQELPRNVITRSFGIGLEEEGPHGTAVAEIIHDVAPDAELYLVNWGRADPDLFNAIDWLIEQQVDIINTSWGIMSGCLNPQDGLLERYAVGPARRAGILWVTAAGNEGQSHWRGPWRDDDGDGVLNFTLKDEDQDLRLPRGDEADIWLQWGDGCTPSSEDYDLFLLDDRGSEVARSTNANRRSGPWENIRYEARSTDIYHIVVKRLAGEASYLDLEVYTSQDIEHQVAEGSVSFAEPAISPNAVTVGAAHWRNHVLMPYSSRGPTPDGRLKPDLAAPTNVTTATYGRYGFTGTSAATPYVAGAAALVKQAFPAWKADQIQAYLKENADDLGLAGDDNDYGAGFLELGRLPAAVQQLVLPFLGLEFLDPGAWESYPVGSCIAYRNISDAPSSLHITLLDGTIRTFSILPDGEVLICDGVAYIEQ
jgi:subtilisin family serine protease